MAKLRINGDSSGYVDLEAPNAASSSTIDLDQIAQTNQNNTFTGGDGVVQTISTTGNQASLKLNSPSTNNDWTITNEGNADRLRFMVTDEVGTRFPMYMHTAGYVTTPSQPSFWATVSNDYTGYNSTDYSSGLIFNTALYNIGGHYSTSTGRFTAPVTGTYLLTAECYTTGQVWDQSWFTLNGSRPNGTDHVQNGQNIVGNTSMIKLNANDWVMFHPYSGNTNNLIKAAPQHTWFKGILLG